MFNYVFREKVEFVKCNTIYTHASALLYNTSAMPHFYPFMSTVTCQCHYFVEDWKQ